MLPCPHLASSRMNSDVNKSKTVRASWNWLISLVVLLVTGPRRIGLDDLCAIHHHPLIDKAHGGDDPSPRIVNPPLTDPQIIGVLSKSSQPCFDITRSSELAELHAVTAISVLLLFSFTSPVILHQPRSQPHAPPQSIWTHHPFHHPIPTKTHPSPTSPTTNEHTHRQR